MKRLLLIALSTVMITLLIACGGTPAIQSDKPNAIKMNGHAFTVTTMTIQKGSTLTFVNSPDAGGLHILVVGKDGQNESENGAPDFGGISGHRPAIEVPGGTTSRTRFSIRSTGCGDRI